MSSFRRVLLAVTLLVLSSGAIRLGFWQLSRLAERQAANQVLLDGQASPPADLSEALRVGIPLAGRRATAVGHFATDEDVLLRGRVHDKVPGLEVMTPFILDSGAGHLWVLRGFIPSPDATTPPDSYPNGSVSSVTIRGVMLMLPRTDDGGQPLERRGVTTYRRLDREFAASLLPEAPEHYLLLDSTDASLGGLPTVPAPPLNDGPHFSYAVQWFCIAFAILAFGFIALRPVDPARVRHPAAP